MDEINILELYNKMEQLYSTESWKKFYRPKLNKFFSQYNNGAPVESITPYHVKEFLKEFEDNSHMKLNYYNALCAFYSLAHEQTKILNIMQDIPKPIVIRKAPKYVCEKDVIKIQEFIDNKNNKLYDRLLLGLLLYTGLPRRYIYDLQNSNIKPDEKLRYSIWICDENGEHRIPISHKLKNVIDTYLVTTKNSSPNSKVFKYSHDTSISVRVTTLTKNITGRSYSMNVIGNTFIKLALACNPDVYSIGRIALKSVATIEKHLTANIDADIFKYQTEIVDKI